MLDLLKKKAFLIQRVSEVWCEKQQEEKEWKHCLLCSDLFDRDLVLVLVHFQVQIFGFQNVCVWEWDLKNHGCVVAVGPCYND